MDTLTLIRILNAMRDAHEAANWQGKFTADIREATKDHRLTKIAEPLQKAIDEAQKEVDKRSRRRVRLTNIKQRSYRAPYKDD